jgi:PKD repeat protein
MKKQLLFASLFLASGLSMLAQSGRVITPVTLDAVNRPVADLDRNATCTADTLRYALIKEYIMNPTPAFSALPINPTEEQSQAFISPGTISVVGIDFRARVNSSNAAATVPVKVYLYSVNAAFQPLVRLDSATINVITTTVKYYHVNFSAPHTVTGNYAVAVAAVGTFKFDVIANDRDVAAGGEALSYNKWTPATTATWFPNANATSGWGQDFDADISPIVTYSIATDYTMSAPSPFCIGASVTFTNTTTPANTLSARMYNFNAFNFYFGVSASDSTYAWDMGDASATIWSTNATYAYTAAGSYNATLYTLAGFWNSCVDTKVNAVVVTPNAVASYTQDATASPLILFTSTSTGATSYSWNFGDGSPADLTANPSHTYVAPGTYTVVLTVSNSCNTTTSTQTVTILATDIATTSAGSMNLFPNPSSTGVFTVEMVSAAKTNVEVYNMVGELIYSTVLNATTSTLDLSTLGAGMYSVKIRTNDQNIVKQIVITK